MSCWWHRWQAWTSSGRLSQAIGPSGVMPHMEHWQGQRSMHMVVQLLKAIGLSGVMPHVQHVHGQRSMRMVVQP